MRNRVLIYSKRRLNERADDEKNDCSSRWPRGNRLLGRSANVQPLSSLNISICSEICDQYGLKGKTNKRLTFAEYGKWNKIIWSARDEC